MITDQNIVDIIGFVKQLASDEPLSGANLVKLKEELSKPEYDGMSLEQTLVHIVSVPVIDNPIPRPKHKKLVIDQKSFRYMLTIIIARAEIDGTAEQIETWKKFEKTLESAAQQADGVSTSAAHFASMVAALIQSGLITAEEFESLAYDADPLWQPRITGKSIASTLFPGETNPVVTPGDILLAKK